MIQLCIVVPHETADKLISASKFSWKKGRCNAYTQTLTQIFDTEEHAKAAVAKTTYIWALESPGV